METAPHVCRWTLLPCIQKLMMMLVTLMMMLLCSSSFSSSIQLFAGPYSSSVTSFCSVVKAEERHIFGDPEALPCSHDT